MVTQPTFRNRMLRISVLVVLIMFAFSAWAWFQLPADASVPVHWGINGQANGYGGKAEGLLLMPTITLALSVLFYFLPRLDPKGENILRSGSAYRALWIVLLIFFLGMHTVTTLIALGVNLQINQFILPAISVLMIVMGNYMGKVRQNYMMGIRTPWTLANEEVWNKTHRLGGRLFVISGILSLLASLFGPLIGLIVFGASMSISVGWTVIYSYVTFTQINKESTSNS
ncbi:MAG: SdpI family protein [Caldilineaceae bacterium]